MTTNEVIRRALPALPLDEAKIARTLKRAAEKRRPPMREVLVADLKDVHDLVAIDRLAPRADYAVVLHHRAVELMCSRCGDPFEDKNGPSLECSCGRKRSTNTRRWRAKVYARKGNYGLLPLADVGPCHSDTGARSAAHAIAMRHAARTRRGR